MSNFNRYDIKAWASSRGEDGADWTDEKTDDGDYVLFEDAAAIEAWAETLQARIAELEALVREVYVIEPSWGFYALMIEREVSDWMKDAHRLCPPQEDA